MNRALVSLLAALLLASCATVPPEPDPAARAAAEAAAAAQAAEARRLAEIAKRDPAQPLPDGLYVEFATARGAITAELFFEKMPLTVANFAGLAEGTLGPAPRKAYFDGQIFHRVVPGFVIQGGDPTGTGRGDPGYKFPDEFAAGLRHDGPGLLSMANSGPDTNGSQFFITLGPARYLDFNHAIFGRVVRGGDVPGKIQRGDAMNTVKIIRVGAAAQAFRADEGALTALAARLPPGIPPPFEDQTSLNSGPPPFQARYLGNRLTNLARFTGRRIYVRLLDDIPDEPAGQTAAQASAALAARLRLPPGAILACYFLRDNQWAVAGAPADFVLPAPKPDSPENAARSPQARMFAAAEQVVSALIDHTDPK
ncbi:MAG: peptidylprolyl isomerase [Opitutaceae bacterium]|nr:peptidylprolyl isomerase [Opitutaceae bacterium]